MTPLILTLISLLMLYTEDNNYNFWFAKVTLRLGEFKVFSLFILASLMVIPALEKGMLKAS